MKTNKILCKQKLDNGPKLNHVHRLILELHWAQQATLIA